MFFIFLQYDFVAECFSDGVAVSSCFKMSFSVCSNVRPKFTLPVSSMLYSMNAFLSSNIKTTIYIIIRIINTPLYATNNRKLP